MPKEVIYVQEEEDNIDEPMTYSWMLFFVVFIFILVISTAVVVGVAVSQYGDSLPQNIDIVVCERDREITLAQVTAIDQNMNFRRNIYIQTSLHDNGPANFTDISQVYYVNFTPVDPMNPEVLNEYFLAINTIKNVTNVPDVADHCMFLADQTVPFRFIQKANLFYGNRPRVFNFLRDKAETDFFATYFNYTAPCFVMETKLFDDIPQPGNVENFMLFSVSQQRLTLRNDFNRDIFVNADNVPLISNYTKQFSELVSSNPLFATFHVTGTEQVKANASLALFLNAQFVV